MIYYIALGYLIASMFFIELFLPSFLHFIDHPMNTLETLVVTMLGLAPGALVTVLRPIRCADLASVLRIGLPTYALSIPATFFLVLYALPPQTAGIAYLFVVPFFINSLLSVSILARLDIRRCYLVILIGSGAGCLSIYLLLRLLGAEGTVLLLVLGGLLLWAFLVTLTSSRRRAGVAMVAVAATIIGLGVLATTPAGRFLSFRTLKGSNRSVDPHRFDQPPGPSFGSLRAVHWPTLSRSRFRAWNAMAALDIYQHPWACSGIWKLDQAAVERLDRLAPAVRVKEDDPLMVYVNDRPWTEVNHVSKAGVMTLRHFTARPRALVIGVGGGGDMIHIEKELGAPEVVGVEINPDLVHAMRGGLGRYLASTLKEQEIVIADGRTYVRMSDKQFDLIFLSFADLFIYFPNSLVQMENYLYTTEAMVDYWERLTPRGLIFFGYHLSLKRPAQPDALLRILTTVHAALRGLGVARPADHVVVQRDPLHPRKGFLIVSKRPLERQVVRRYLTEYRHRDRYPNTFLYYPGKQRGDNPFAAYMLASNRDRWLERYPLDVSPVTDDRPFFFDFDRSHAVIGDQLLRFGQLALGLVVVPAFLLLLGYRSLRQRVVLAVGTAGILVTIGHALLEAELIKALGVYIGSPIHSLSLVLFAFFTLSGLGLQLVRWLPGRRGAFARWLSGPRVPAISLCLLVVLALAFAVFVPPLLDHLRFESMAARLVVAVLLVTPLSLVAGIPYPYLLDRLPARERAVQIPFVLGLSNLAFSAAVALAMYVSIHHGYSVLWYGALSAYLLALLCCGMGRGPALNRGP